MNNNRPKIKVALTSIDKLFNITALVLLIIHIVFLIVSYQELPKIIPTHFGINGKPDDYGNKGTILILPIIAAVIFILFTVLTKYPHIHNYPINITEKNAKYFYSMSNRLLRFMNVIINSLFLYITFGSIQIVKTKFTTLSPVILVGFIIIILLSVVYFLIKTYSYKEEI
jgi:uncharacterized membrane protein